jgi:hypothetical protein
MTRKIKHLKPGEKIQINELETTFSHISPDGHPVFNVRHNGYTGHYQLTHLTEDNFITEIK